MKEFHVLFRIPKEEKLIDCISYSKLPSNSIDFNSSLWKNNSEIPGKLYLSENFISFCAPSQLILTVPFLRMHKIVFDGKYILYDNDSGFAIRISLDLKPNGKRRALLFSLKNSDAAEATKIVEQSLIALQLTSILGSPTQVPLHKMITI